MPYPQSADINKALLQVLRIHLLMMVTKFIFSENLKRMWFKVRSTTTAKVVVNQNRQAAIDKTLISDSFDCVVQAISLTSERNRAGPRHADYLKTRIGQV